jgi:hypothetical protein
LTPQGPEYSKEAVSDLSSESGAPENEIEVTPEMIEAGILYLLQFSPRKGLGEEEAVEAIFRAMYSARPQRFVLPAEAGAPEVEAIFTPEMIDEVTNRIARHLIGLADGILPIQAEATAECIMDEITSSFRLLPLRQE